MATENWWLLYLSPSIPKLAEVEARLRKRLAKVCGHRYTVSLGSAYVGTPYLHTPSGQVHYGTEQIEKYLDLLQQSSSQLAAAQSA